MDRQVATRQMSKGRNMLAGAAVALAAMLSISVTGVALAREAPPPTWDGMKRVDRPGLDAVYLPESRAAVYH